MAQLQHYRDNWRELQAALDANPLIPQPNYVADWIREMYGLTIAVGIRRQGDRARDVITLRRLIDDVARNPTAISRSFYVERYPEFMRQFSDHPHREFDTFAGPEGEHPDPALIRDDLAELGRIIKVVADYVNKHLAHRAARADVPIPTYDDLDRALDEFDRLLKRYYLLIDGSGLVSSTPVKQYDFLRPLLVAWKPDTRRLRVLLQHDREPVSLTSPEIEARAQLARRETPTSDVVEALLATIEALRAEQRRELDDGRS